MVLIGLAGGLTEVSWVLAKEFGLKSKRYQGFPLNCDWSKNKEGVVLDMVVNNEGAQGPSSGQRVSAMQLFWLHSCHWPPGNAATTGSSSKAV